MSDPFNVLTEALPEARIIRVTARRGSRREIYVGRAWGLDSEALTIRDLAHRHRHRIDLDTLTDVEIIGIYLKDYGA